MSFKRPTYDDDQDTSLVLEQRAGTSDSAENSLIYHNPHLALSIQQQRNRLPITKYKNQILYLVDRYRCTILVGETGSGKSTQVPQVCFLEILNIYSFGLVFGRSRMGRQWTTNWNHGAETGCCNYGLFLRVYFNNLCVWLATRVASEMQCAVGDRVGYVLRFNEVMSERTKVKVCFN